MMNEKNKPTRAKMFDAAKVITIFLLGIAGGVGLICVVQPPKAPDSLAYEMFLFTSDQPLDDFSQQVEAMKSNRSGVISWIGGDLGGRIHFAASSGMRTRFNMVVYDDTTAFATLTGCQFDIQGETARNRVRVGMEVVMGESHTIHELNLGPREYRVVELRTGVKGQKKWVYGILVVEPTKATPLPGLAAPRAAPGGGSGVGAASKAS